MRRGRGHLALQHRLEPAFGQSLLEALLVLTAQPEEGVLAIDDGDVITRLLAQGQSHLDRAVTAADHDTVAATVRGSVEQPVGQVRQVFARYLKTTASTMCAARSSP